MDFAYPNTFQLSAFTQGHISPDNRTITHCKSIFPAILFSKINGIYNKLAENITPTTIFVLVLVMCIECEVHS